MPPVGRTSRNHIPEIRSLTGLRGIAALWVVVLHAVFVPRPWNVFLVLAGNGYLAVDLFFVLSGYVMALNYGQWFDGMIKSGDYFAFLNKRFARTYPLYAVATLATLALSHYDGFSFWAFPPQVCGASAIMPNIFLIQEWHTPFCSLDAPGWSISAEWGAYLLFPLLCQVTLIGPKLRVWAAVLISFGFLLVVSSIPKTLLGQPGGPWGPLAISNGQTLAPGIRCLSEFTIGLASYRLSRSRLGVALSANFVSLAVTILLLWLLFRTGLDVVVVSLFPFLIVSLAQDRGLIASILGSRPVYFFGVISYSVYLVHFPILMIVERIRFMHYGFQNYTVAFATICLAIPIATATYYLVERPGRRAITHAFSRMTVGVRAT